MHTPKHALLAFFMALVISPVSFSHVVLQEPAALAGRTYRASLQVGHGCDGAPTSSVTVMLPAGFRGAKPMPKAGWNISITRMRLDKPYTDHGRKVEEDVSEITWTASAPEFWLPDAHFDEFVLRGGLPAKAGPLWFKVVQLCSKGRLDWTEVPASGTSTKGLKSPAALLEVIDSGAPGHQH
jgi:uncharacterized protein YcnI